MSALTITIDEINKLKINEVVNNEKVKNRFLQIYSTLWGEEQALGAYEKESHFFSQIISDNPKWTSLTPFSVYQCFLDVAVSGLSVQPGQQPMAYLIPRNVNIGNNAQGKAVFESRLQLKVTGYGEIFTRTRAGQIRHADNPVVVYENDIFQIGTKDGKKFVNYTCNLPHKGQKIIGGFISITRNDGSGDFAWLLEEDIDRLASYSAKANRKWNDDTKRYEYPANALYTSNNGSIDTGFLCAKLIKHAFKTYPKVRMGKATVFESDDIQEEEMDIYGFEETVKEEPKHFAPAEDMSKGYSVKSSAEDDCF